MSTDQGANWTQRTATGMPDGTQGGYSFHMAVDPGSPGDGANDIIYFATVGHSALRRLGQQFHRAHQRPCGQPLVGVLPAGCADTLDRVLSATTADCTARPMVA